MGNNSNAFKAIIALIFIMVGVFVYLNYVGDDGTNRNQPTDDSTTTIVGPSGEEEGAEDSGLSARETAVTEFCDCFTDLLDLRSQVEEEPRLEFELSSKIKKEEIKMRSCYAKTKQRHGGFGESILEDFAMACPDAQEEL